MAQQKAIKIAELGFFKTQIIDALNEIKLKHMRLKQNREDFKLILTLLRRILKRKGPKEERSDFQEGRVLGGMEEPKE